MNAKTSNFMQSIFPAVPTVFDLQFNLDLERLQANLEPLVAVGLPGVVIGGSNGEFVTQSPDERVAAVAAARAVLPGDRILIAGSAMESTAATSELVQRMAEAGADAALVLTPHYYTSAMTDAALIAHYQAVADTSPIPILLYNMPPNTGLDLSWKVICTLAEHPQITGLKDSSGNLVKLGQLVSEVGPDFQLLVGSGALLLPALALGAAGCVAALANVAGGAMLQLREKFMAGDWEAARALQLPLIAVNQAITAEHGIAGLKAALEMLGMAGGPVRPPLTALSDSARQELRQVLQTAGLLEKEPSDSFA
jgi:4-hydroxy-2-oxoglutarate aldolase